METPFRPARWLPGPHAQTIGARLLRPSRGVTFRRERLELPDGDFVDLDWALRNGEAHPPAKGPVVLVLHGLEGTARSKYMLEMYRALARERLFAVGMNFRSCSGEPNRLPRLYHSGDTADIAYAVGTLSERYGGPVGVAGFSLGGNALLKWLGEHGEGAARYVRGAAAISVPFDLAAGERILQRPGGRVYLLYLLRKLQRKVRLKREQLADLVDVEALLRARTFREFDELGTAPLHGFADANDYYTRSSSGQFVDRIRVPTALIHALDDPFLPARAVPLEPAADNPFIEPYVSERGGHVGFVTGLPLRPIFWAERTAARFLARQLRSDGTS